MADNLPLKNDDATAIGTVATDEISGIHYPRSKIGFGVDGSYIDVSADDPLPVLAEFPASLAVTQSGTWTVGIGSALPAGSHTIGAVNLAEYTAVSGRLPVDGSGVTQPVSHAATAQADGHSVTIGAQADSAAVADTSTASLISLFKRLLQRLTTLMGQMPAALTGSGNLKVSLNESNTTQAVSDGGASLTVDGTLAATQSGSWAVTCNAGTDLNTSTLALESGGNLAAAATSLSTIAGAVDGTEVQVDVVSSALPSGAATAAKQPALGTAGTASADVLTVQGITSMTPLSVSDGGSSLTIDGTITANAGTNLNTSALALETGGNLAASATSLAIIDDWDESDRAKVNLIAGQAGVTGGAGAVAANTPRVTLASDDPAVASLDEIEGAVETIETTVATVSATSVVRVALFDASDTQVTSFASVQHAEDAAHTTGDVGTLVLTVRSDTAASTAGTDGDYAGLITDANGRLHVIAAIASSQTIAVTNAGTFAVQAAQSGTWTVTGTGGTFPVTDSGGSLTVDAPVGTPVFVRLSDGTDPLTTLPVSMASVPSHAVTNAGTFVVQVDGTALTRLTDIETNTDFGTVTGGGVEASALRVTIASDSTGVLSVDDGGSSLTVDDGGTSLTVDGTVAVSSVSGNVSVLQSGLWSVAIGSALPTGSNTIGAVSQNGTWTVGLSAGTASVGKVVPEASASGTGTTAYRNAALSNTVQEVKASAGRLYGVHCYNPNASVVYLQFYDHASPLVGTTTPTRTYAVPAGGWLTMDLTIPQTFGTEINVAATTTAGGSTAPGTALILNLEYL